MQQVTADSALWSAPVTRAGNSAHSSTQKFSCAPITPSPIPPLGQVFARPGVSIALVQFAISPNCTASLISIFIMLVCMQTLQRPQSSGASRCSDRSQQPLTHRTSEGVFCAEKYPTIPRPRHAANHGTCSMRGARPSSGCISNGPQTQSGRGEPSRSLLLRRSLTTDEGL